MAMWRIRALVVLLELSVKRTLDVQFVGEDNSLFRTEFNAEVILCIAPYQF